jgi:hypothetical protein
MDAGTVQEMLNSFNYTDPKTSMQEEEEDERSYKH